MVDKAHLEVCGGESALHESSDFLWITWGLGQVHLHCEPAAKPAQGFYKQSTVMMCLRVGKGVGVGESEGEVKEE